MNTKIIALMCLLAISAFAMELEQNCHPQCAWKCDDPKCPAVCSPICEPPKCHSSCQEPKNAVCDVKCEKPDCQIMCPDKACEAEDCPKCVTVCKAPHCVTHCQAPKPDCEAVCEEPKCDWKCQKPECPKPKCELVCENPGCRPKVECCKCAEQNNGFQFPMFKETEKDPKCCNCQNKDVVNVNAPQTSVNFQHFQQQSGQNGQIFSGASDAGLQNATYVSHEKTHYSVNALPHPIRIGPSYYKKPEELIKRIEAPVKA